MANLHLRGSTWHLKRRVPKRYAEVEPRAVIWESLSTDSRTVAVSKAERVWAGYISGWEALLAGHSEDAQVRFRAARDLADMRGFAFLPAATVAERSLQEVLARVEATRGPDGRSDPVAASGVLGGVNEPTLKLSELVARAEALSVHDNRFKSAEQMRLWRNPRVRAVRNRIAALGGDRRVVEIGAAEARLHRRWWQARIADEGQSSQTANKDFHYISGMLVRFYEDIDHADPPRPYMGVSIRDRHAKVQRKDEVPFAFITERWFALGAFNGLNDEARDILLIALETGCRQSEIHDLPASAFKLDAHVPHLCVRNEAAQDPDARREIKNRHSERDVPLVGVALAAARRHPDGFPRYRNKRSYSAIVNKYLKAHDLVPEGVTVGGLRHTWESRLKTAGLHTDDRGELMGHSVKALRGREHYGDEMDLERRRALAASIAFTVPEHLA
ncbi:hypothetical protein SAMN06273572_1143 [Monaibacterium marinum]|uniref:Tyr recombinase domain-containing protein n=1 Tax=Pontivivens marinum TaxID=1690039 RepID=A0A2C9CWG4_9RHOB|nr:DUF6538 domain-containing protein [Monaibacterium marinum]SOH95634.1 hypothetical protein SAMN06273572_1143 [Monaibacterium marinum]